ncbi:aurora kinase A and ninein-interacting protein [Bombina bombina]|uniref:aurora kinase A and ninein-interacting protein n=1 Tax=Bombina bombina TaxID=8345 RepID=UPI00235AE0A1|nr:aurora kinase A and ninein-interacting protein [Bombina bombina]
MKLKGRDNGQPEECGVWLDTSELKRKPQQQTLLRNTSSIRFHPFAKRKTIDSILLEFTQTPAPPTCTKQTSMISFFTPADKKNGLNKVQHSDPSTAIKEALEFGVKSNNTTIINDVHKTCQVKSGSPKSVKDACKLMEHQEPLESYNKQRNKQTENKKGQHETVCTLEEMGSFQTNTDIESKENLPPSSDYWDLSHRTEKIHPYRIVSDSTGGTLCQEKELSSMQENLNSSLLNSQLFTQDSQGNKVICHRPAKKNRCSRTLRLQDLTNDMCVLAGPPSTSQPHLCEDSFRRTDTQQDVSLQSMFTQDSEGNVVIKH